MKKIFTVISFVLAFAATANASDEKRNATIALAQDIVAHYNNVGLADGCKDFSDKSGDFIKYDGELYGVLIDLEGRILCHAVNPKLNDKVLINAKDPNGVKIVQEEIKISKAGGDGWFDYMWPNPNTKKIASKS